MFANKFKDISSDKMPKYVISMSALDSMIPISLEYEKPLIRMAPRKAFFASKKT